MTSGGAGGGVGGPCDGLADNDACDGGFCCAGACVASSDDNCGACGRACTCLGGAACVAEPVQTTTNNGVVTSLEQSATHVYWAVAVPAQSAGYVERVQKLTANVQPVISGINALNGALPYNGWLYITQYASAGAGGVQRCDLNNNCPGLDAFFAPTNFPYACPHLYAEGTNQLYLCQAAPDSLPLHCDGASCATYAAAPTSAGIASDGTRIYYSDDAGKVMTAPLMNNGASQYALAALPEVITPGDDGKMYWYEAGLDQITRANQGPTSAGSLETVLTNVTGVHDLQVGGGWMYWSNYTAGSTTVEGCRPEDCEGTRTVVADLSAVPGQSPEILLYTGPELYLSTSVLGLAPSTVLRVPAL